MVTSIERQGELRAANAERCTTVRQMVRSRAERRQIPRRQGKWTVSESGDGGEYDGREERRETKQHAHQHERDACNSLEITRRTDGDGFSGRRLPKPHARQPALHTLVPEDQPPGPSFVPFVFCVRPGHSSLHLRSSVEFYCKHCGQPNTTFSSLNPKVPGSTKHGRVWTRLVREDCRWRRG